MIKTLKVKNHLKGYIGQAPIVAYANRLLSAVEENRHVPLQPLEFTGYAGLGKTSFTNILANKMAEVSGKEFSFTEIPSGVTLPDFLSHWNNFIAGRRVVIFMDEAHGLKNEKVKNLLKAILETQRSVKDINYAGHTVVSNPFQQLFVFATNGEPNDPALFGPTSRTKQLMFQPFSRSEALAVIYQKAEKAKLRISETAAEFLVDRVLPNGRAISELIENDAALVGGVISLDVAKALVAESGRYKLGLKKADIVTLMFIGKDEKGKQVQEIAAATGGEDNRTARVRLQWLAGLSLIRTAGNGRKVLTQGGLDYLDNLQKDVEAVKAKAKVARAKAKASIAPTAPRLKKH